MEAHTLHIFSPKFDFKSSQMFRNLDTGWSTSGQSSLRSHRAVFFSFSVSFCYTIVKSYTLWHFTFLCLYASPKEMDVLLYHHNTVTTPKKRDSDSIMPSNIWCQVPPFLQRRLIGFFSNSKFSQGSRSAFGYISLDSYRMVSMPLVFTYLYWYK